MLNRRPAECNRSWLARCGAAAALALAVLPSLVQAQTGTVTGTVTSAATGTPLSNNFVYFCSISNGVTSAACFGHSTNATGFYSASLPPATYYAYTGFSGYINEIYDNIPCAGVCDLETASSAGTPIVVAAGATVSGRDFSLERGASITGVVADETTGTAIQGVSVRAYLRLGTRTVPAGSASTNSSGVYTITGLVPGAYYANVSGAAAGYTSEVYDDILCPGACSTSLTANSGRPIPVGSAASVTGIDFSLTAAGRITGTVVNGQTSAPIQGVSVLAYARIGAEPAFFGSATTNAAGAYSIGGLPPGTYQLLTQTSLAFNEIYDDILCSDRCSSFVAVASGTPVPVTAGAISAGKDFQLAPGGAVSGTVVDAATLAPVAAVSVSLYRQNGAFAVQVGSATTNASGVYTLGGLAAGTYFALATPNSTYTSQVAGGAQCRFCSDTLILAGTPLVVSVGATTNLDVGLQAAASISGIVTDATTLAPLAGVTVTLVVSPSLQVGFQTDAAGAYTFDRLPGGTYKVFTASSRHQNKAYNDVLCPAGGCSQSFVAANGAPVVATGGASTAGINFSLSSLSAAPGPPLGLTATAVSGATQITWLAPTSGGAPTGYILEAGLSPGTTIGTLPAATPLIAITGVPPGTYYLRVRAVNAFGTGPASAEFMLNLSAAGHTTLGPPTTLVAWMSGNRLNVSWAAASSEPAGATYILEAGSAAGRSNLAVLGVANRSFTFAPLPSGFFFLRVRSTFAGATSASSNEVMVNVGGVPAPPSAPQNFSVSRSGTATTLSWTAPVVGAPASYVVEAGTSAGATDIGVVNTGSSVPSLVVPGVPAGAYYLRVRAVNAQGAGAASNERLLTVP